MGYLEQILGDSEQVVHQTRRHAIVLFQRAIGWLLASVIFLGVGLAVLVPSDSDQGSTIRFLIGLIALISLVVLFYLIITAWARGHRGRGFFGETWRPVLAAIVILAVALIMMLRPDLRYMGWVAIVLALVALTELVRSFLKWRNECYIITNRRVMELRGIINKNVRDSALEKVNDVNLTQSVVGRMLGYGTVQIITGSDIGANVFRRISGPVRFKRAMLNAKEQWLAASPPDESEDAPPQAPSIAVDASVNDESAPAAADIPDLILDLDELRQKGILSEQEFQEKKRELLDRL